MAFLKRELIINASTSSVRMLSLRVVNFNKIEDLLRIKLSWRCKSFVERIVNLVY